ncbi:MAG: pyridoxal-phosphate dependent enzyme, partial [Thermoleophilia bacterium]|nr:pyridoxal-phosphate dependent enzyme [Thermoleophilia bacterium]
MREIEQARGRLERIARVTPVFSSETLSRLTGRAVHLKAENLQRTGSFKVRGAVNKIALLSAQDRRRGVVAASAGNHGQAVAWGAREEGVLATVFMPEGTPMAKVEATRNYGAQTKLVGEHFGEALAAALEFTAENDATFVHAFEDEEVIAGQGTIALELVEQVPDVDAVVVPVGGGGLAAGIALALRAVRPSARIVGVQAATCAPLAGGEERGFTIAEGIAVKEPGALTAAVLRETLDDIVTVTDEEISQAIVLLLERTKLLVEGAGAAPVAALLAGRVPGEGRAAPILSGGNIDATLLISVMRHGLTTAGRYLVLRTRLADRP